jgi:Undecaprenyl-phosphate galactose phosphotransferase WbaP
MNTPMGITLSSRRRIRSPRLDHGIAILLITDLAVVATTGVAALGLRLLLPGSHELRLDDHLALWPGLFAFPLCFAALGLYRTVLVHSAEELRRTTYAISLVWIFAAAALTLTRSPVDAYSRLALVFAWGGSLITVPLIRHFIRHLCGPCSWWGKPVLVLGAGTTGQWVVKHLQAQPWLGLKPRLILDDDYRTHDTLHGIPVQGPLERAPILAQEQRLEYAIITVSGISTERLQALGQRYQSAFTHLLIIPNIHDIASLWVEPRDLGGMLGLEVRHNLLLPGPRILKRAMDLILCTIFFLPFIALIGILALFIILDSRGPVFYSQERIGRDGRRFRAWKFRSMMGNADAVLKTYLDNNPTLRDEWERDHKLRNDPRITRIGRILRVTSLDELPQIFNVLIGDMSLVGPRPIVAAETQKYGDTLDLYTRVRPGLSGLWQVSGRNNTTYAERVAMDSYYVRNWSVWLDLTILAATVRVVLRREGAY